MNAPDIAAVAAALPQIGLMLHMQPEPGETLPGFFARRGETVVAAEALGVQAVWVTEHHFDPTSQSASPLLLLAHWAGSTRRVQLGVAAVLAAGRNPIRLAEDIALLSNLAPGRIAIGFAKGGPFEAHKRAFGWGDDAARQGMREVVQAVLDLHCGRNAAGGAALQPAVRRPLPMFVASRDPDTLAWAARNGLGWMSAQFWSAELFDAQAAHWAAHAAGAPDALLSRGLWIDDDGQAARRHALQWLAGFRADKRAQWAPGFRGPLADMDDAASLGRMVVGTPRDCAQQLAALLSGRQVPRLAFNPLHPRPEQQLLQMRRLIDEVWPQLAAQHGRARRGAE